MGEITERYFYQTLSMYIQTLYLSKKDHLMPPNNKIKKDLLGVAIFKKNNIKKKIG